MLIDQLRRIPEFRSTAPTELRALAQHAQVLCIPANRWLAQPGRELTGYYYLLKGAIQTFAPDVRLASSVAGDLCHFYPGCAGARTTFASQVVRIDPKHYEFLLTRGVVDTSNCVQIPHWLERFLTSHMMSHLPASQWRRVLQAFVPKDYGAAAPLLTQGENAEHCYVLERGHAVIHRGSRTLCHLGPGDFFGEDALIMGCQRNADVTSLDSVRVQTIGKQTFDALLLDSLVHFVQSRGTAGGILLNVGATPMSGAIPVSLTHLREQLAGFDPGLDYFIAGGAQRERALCAFLLAQRGMRAHPLE